jgi:hypothetical protein
MEPDRALDAAYRATAYTAETPAGLLIIRIGESNTALARLLVAHHVTSWAYLTAHNPGSAQLSAAENDLRQSELRSVVRQSGYVFFEGAGIGDGWPPEASLLVFGMSAKEAAALGSRFGQLAVVIGELGAPARLLWLRPDGADADSPQRL